MIRVAVLAFLSVLVDDHGPVFVHLLYGVLRLSGLEEVIRGVLGVVGVLGRFGKGRVVGDRVGSLSN